MGPEQHDTPEEKKKKLCFFFLVAHSPELSRPHAMLRLGGVACLPFEIENDGGREVHVGAVSSFVGYLESCSKKRNNKRGKIFFCLFPVRFT